MIIQVTYNLMCPCGPKSSTNYNCRLTLERLLNPDLNLVQLYINISLSSYDVFLVIFLIMLVVEMFISQVEAVIHFEDDTEELQQWDQQVMYF